MRDLTDEEIGRGSEDELATLAEFGRDYLTNAQILMLVQVHERRSPDPPPYREGHTLIHKSFSLPYAGNLTVSEISRVMMGISDAQRARADPGEGDRLYRSLLRTTYSEPELDEPDA